MSAKTKIVVLHMKELIYTGIFAALGVLFVILLIIMFLPDKDTVSNSDLQTNPAVSDGNLSGSLPVSSDSLYTPGIYTTEIILGGQTICVEVIVGQDIISSIRLTDVNESVSTMYPLLEPTLESICEQVCETQSLEDITYSSENKYTSLVLLESIRTSLDKASKEANN